MESQGAEGQRGSVPQQDSRLLILITSYRRPPPSGAATCRRPAEGGSPCPAANGRRSAEGGSSPVSSRRGPTANPIQPSLTTNCVTPKSASRLLAASLGSSNSI